jgi:hypothetical protein
MLGAIIFWAIAIGILLLLPLAIASLWRWGGARRGALGHFMAGALLLVSGAVFYYVQVINVFARMDNTYLYNTIFGPYFMLLGVTLLIGSLIGYGVPPWLAALLWVPSVVVGRVALVWLWIAFFLFAPAGLIWLVRAVPPPWLFPMRASSSTPRYCWAALFSFCWRVAISSKPSSPSHLRRWDSR